jgi:hypothetical protein
MNINEFKSGEYEQQYEYQSFLPSFINWKRPIVYWGS